MQKTDRLFPDFNFLKYRSFNYPNFPKINKILGNDAKSFKVHNKQKKFEMILVESSYVLITCFLAPSDSLGFFDKTFCWQSAWRLFQPKEKLQKLQQKVLTLNIFDLGFNSLFMILCFSSQNIDVDILIGFSTILLFWLIYSTVVNTFANFVTRFKCIVLVLI